MLPAWAKNPHDFVQKHRQALESDHASEHLNEWIDLIFGFKQRGPEAEKALNVFYYTAYENALEIAKRLSEQERVAQEGMIREFGQVPSQLFTKAHPKRMTQEEALRARTGGDSAFVPLALTEAAPEDVKKFIMSADVKEQVTAVFFPATAKARPRVRGL